MRELVFVSVLYLSIPSLSLGLTMEMVTVGDPGNAPDPLNTSVVPGIGSVAYTYAIGKHEVQNSQYAEFLNSVAATDTYGLYNSSMDSDARGGITRSGSSGSYTYSVKSGYENVPVVFISFYDAARFVNWLENGQGGAGTTEYGSYTLFTNGSTTTNISARAANATWVIPTENEWYKAAYYDPTASGTTNYWLYPTQSDAIPNSRPPNGTDANSANFYRDDGSPDDFLNDGFAKTGSTSDYSGTNYLTDVGAYTLAASYYGTFDQGGNVWELNETLIDADRGLRGGDWLYDEYGLRSSYRDRSPPTGEYFGRLGFRVAMIPEPGTFVAMALVGLAACVWCRRRR
ncbi:MAG TPA: SUMF1/EgtB/PvdO family nonheme iron enzyme [Verrucomicrobiae bacterium]|nr:SUMF1/EgtB/PvdO family nonheme iron enzyme [Verrucomicrobiae bacterium]